MEVRSHLLYDGGQVKFVATPHLSAGINTRQYIIIHYTGGTTFMSGVWWHSDPKAKVSAHLHLGREGEIIQMAAFDRIAWHAGVSEWKGLTSLNRYSIGIELQNTGSQEYTETQLNELVDVCKALVTAYPTIKEILGHSDISPGRKADPGKQFPMEWLRDQVFGNGKVKPERPATGVAQTMVTTANLNLREYPSMSARVFDTLPKGTEVKILQRGSGWNEVFVCKNSLRGWVSSQYLK
ncbi:MAG TPA: N-acetylmuramoyl-L-alanine amidase [Sphingobacterium sp.]|nr:N-acetylmuramoyl-L-alanine amidase [Sphingobacterium sp.]